MYKGPETKSDGTFQKLSRPVWLDYSELNRKMCCPTPLIGLSLVALQPSVLTRGGLRRLPWPWNLIPAEAS